ncbi:UDP-N-acetylmuramoyl-L-alanine--D-glutamate ligase [Ructibacterium gallinarum]|uniref:UDP-N-acetylmuramoylalanine--D-glutamate ligase n=1 Tax=Ructibacterium gallinarum TaxID=2779355 RepID=A0A9D5M0J1_9FIRM|nr:UDP-N-acetylmuramoyl-L-alanine--D-glutamate ligase [Ructibacterium gallinarum]MBE5040402.1 UDP-N-acetylmuramoyl-L-alanine--D-glutamate ligase [Ructibacterium gallinarum]
MTVQEWKTWAKDREMAVIGIGVSNLPLIRFLIDCGVKVTAHDKRTPEQLGEIYDELTGVGVKLVLGEHYLDCVSDSAEIVFKTPGVRYDVPALLKAAECGAEITSEMELFFSLCPAKKIAVTGSDGKTTTTSLIYDMLCRAGYTCYLGGNIGHPLIGEIEKIQPGDVAVLELSSFQLHTMKQSPDIAVVTNVTPNHLDWHKNFQEYIDAKKAIFAYQNEDGKVILNFDNEITRGFRTEAHCAVCFSSREFLPNGYSLQNHHIVYAEGGQIKRDILDIRDIYIPGMHNVENYMAAIGAVDGLVGDDVIRETARDFKGVPHRIEFVRELDGVKYYNDSIASSPARTTAGLKSFGTKKVILIAGGYDKKIPFDDFGVVVNDHVKKLVLVGLTSEKIEAAVKAARNYVDLPIFRCTEFEDAVCTARKEAEPGDIVILSPACASFDLFKNFEVRGNTFKEIVNQFE